MGRSFIPRVSCFLLATLSGWSATLPDRLQSFLDSKGGYFSPNCFFAAICAYYPDMKPRYLSEGEFLYYLERDFQPLWEVGDFDHRGIGRVIKPGTVLVFSNTSDSVSHAAFYIGVEDGEHKIFHKPKYGYQNPFAVAPLNEAHLGVKPIRWPGEYGHDFEEMNIRSRPFSHVKAYQFKGIRRKPLVASSPGLSDALTLQLAEYNAILIKALSFSPVEVPWRQMTDLEKSLRKDFKVNTFSPPSGLDAQLGSLAVEAVLQFMSSMEMYEEVLSHQARR